MTTVHQDTSPLPLADLTKWAAQERQRLVAEFANHDPREFALAQTVKLGEEVGELNAEILGFLGYQRRAKSDRYTADSLASELADVVITAAVIADTLDIDLFEAINDKRAAIESRREKAGLLDQTGKSRQRSNTGVVEA